METNTSAVKIGKPNLIRRIFSSDRFGLFIALIFIIAMFSLINKNYFSAKNLLNVLMSGSLSGLVCIGESLLLIGGLMDLSPGSIAAFSGVMAAMLLAAGLPFWLVILMVVLFGVVVGCFNAFFVTQLKINAFIVTLATQSIVRGFCYIISNKGESTLIRDKTFLSMGTTDLFGIIPFPIFFMVLMFIVFYIVLTKTRFGRNVYTVGGNPIAARLVGISTKKTTYMLFIIMGVLGALGGAILAARMNTGQPQACQGLEFSGITAAILGGIAMSGGKGSLAGSFIGLLILQSFNTGLTVINVQSFWQYVANGSLLLVALSFDFLRSRKK